MVTTQTVLLDGLHKCCPLYLCNVYELDKEPYGLNAYIKEGGWEMLAFVGDRRSGGMESKGFGKYG